MKPLCVCKYFSRKGDIHQIFKGFFVLFKKKDKESLIYSSVNGTGILGSLVVIAKNKFAFISHILYKGRFQLEGRCEYKKSKTAGIVKENVR